MSSGSTDLKTASPGWWLRAIAALLVWTSSIAPSDQFGVQGDRGIEHLGDRAVLLGIAGHSNKRGFVQVRHFGAQRQSRPADAETLAFGFERDRGLGGELSRGIAAGLQPERQRHGEATGMRRGDELFGVGTLLIFEPCLERIRGLCEHAGIGGKIAAAGATGAVPNRLCFADHVTSPCCCVLPLTLSAKAMASSPFGVFAFSTSDDRTRSADAQARGAIERRYPIGGHE